MKISGSRLSTYEERLTLWAVSPIETAVEAAEREARDYADSIPGCTYVGLAHAYHLPEGPDHGTEVFSLMRDSALDPTRTSAPSSTPAPSDNATSRAPDAQTPG